MKQTFFILSIVLSIILLSCNSAQNDAVKQQQQALTAMKENTPGSIPTKDGGWTMKAKKKGEDWIAVSMMPTEASGRITGYSADGDWISLYYDKRYMVLGKKITFGEINAADISTDGHASSFAGKKGEMEITSLDDNWAEGKFYFTATTSESDKTIEVTDGFFRISILRK